MRDPFDDSTPKPKKSTQELVQSLIERQEAEVRRRLETSENSQEAMSTQELWEIAKALQAMAKAAESLPARAETEHNKEQDLRRISDDELYIWRVLAKVACGESPNIDTLVPEALKTFVACLKKVRARSI